MKTLTIAIAGNPNCGKTTLFNLLTGTHQHVGNWPGVTVEKKIGVFEKAVSKMFDHEQEGALVKNASGLIRKGKGLVRVEELANQFEVSIKTLERHFNREIGVSPKFFSRIMRLQEVLKLLNDGEEPIWTDIAYSFGYVDQAHFIKDFKDFAGVTPKIYHQQHNTINDSFIG